MPAKSIKLNNVEYEIPPAEAIKITQYIVGIWEKVGRPNDPLSKTGQVVVKAIIYAYEKTYPIEWSEWLEERKEYQNNELSLYEQIKTGRSAASYPMFIYNILRKVFPQTDFSNREFIFKFVKQFPVFQVARRI